MAKLALRGAKSTSTKGTKATGTGGKKSKARAARGGAGGVGVGEWSTCRKLLHQPTLNVRAAYHRPAVGGPRGLVPQCLPQPSKGVGVFTEK